jgi:hypothetical protein
LAWKPIRKKTGKPIFYIGTYACSLVWNLLVPRFVFPPIQVWGNSVDDWI